MVYGAVSLAFDDSMHALVRDLSDMDAMRTLVSNS